MAHLNNPSNGIVRSKEVTGFKVTVKYLPSTYLAYMELNKQETGFARLDSLARLYEASSSFQVLIEPADPTQTLASLLFLNTSSQAEIETIMTTLTYEMEQYISLKFEGEELPPVLSTLESTMESDKKLSYIFTFNQPIKTILAKKEDQEIEFSITKNFFLNTNAAFAFEVDQLTALPGLHIQN